jgi:4-hydroxymandelate oxidase
MNGTVELNKTRRKFLRMLGASPLLASPGFLAGSFANLLAAGEVTERKFLGWLDSFQQSDEVISSPDQAFDVLDFEPAARKALPPAHFGYLATGVDDDGTVRANREGYSRIQIRARRLVDVENVDMSVSLFGTKWNTPIVLSPRERSESFPSRRRSRRGPGSARQGSPDDLVHRRHFVH